MVIQKMITRMIVRVFVLIFLIGTAGARQAEASIFIHEILADPPTVGGDANGDGVVSSSQDEFIELYNSLDQAVDISGWSISDDLRQRHVFAQGTWIDPFGLWVVFGGGTIVLPGSIYSIASTGGLGLNNTGDIVTLFNEQGAMIDQVIYGAEGGKDQSLVRSPERQKGEFVLHTALHPEQRFSPGTFVVPEDHSHAVPEPATCFSLIAGMGAAFFVRKKIAV